MIGKTLISICTKNLDHELKTAADVHLSYDGGVFAGSIEFNAVSGNSKGTVVGPIVNRNRSLKYFSEHLEYDSILILDQNVKLHRPIEGLFEKLELAVTEVKQPFMGVAYTGLPLEAAGEWVGYHKDVNPAAMFITREAFDKVGYFNNTPKSHTLYFQRLMRTYGFSPTILPTFRYSLFFLDVPEYKEIEDNKFDKFAAEIWEGYNLKVDATFLPRKGEY